jgi:hypothetical protein
MDGYADFCVSAAKPSAMKPDKRKPRCDIFLL